MQYLNSTPCESFVSTRLRYLALRCVALRYVPLRYVALGDVTLRVTCRLATSAFSTADQTSVVSLVMILRSCNIPVCFNRVTRFRLKADTAPYHDTFYFVVRSK